MTEYGGGAEEIHGAAMVKPASVSSFLDPEYESFTVIPDTELTWTGLLGRPDPCIKPWVLEILYVGQDSLETTLVRC